jgi:hypothetical protein
VSEHEHTEPEPDERIDEAVEVEEPADAPEDLEEESEALLSSPAAGST